MNELEQIWADLRRLFKIVQTMTHEPSLRDVTEQVERVYYRINTSEDWRIAHSESEVYIPGKELLILAIRTTYPNVDTDTVMDIWYDCNEPISYCVSVAKRRFTDDTLDAMEMWAAQYIECEGHPDGPVMGETFYCDGTCRTK